MSALALVLFLLGFYVLPLARPLPYEWVWVHAPQHWPRLVVAPGGKLMFNGAFYFEMALYWSACLLFALALQWLARHDDPNWDGLFAGFTRRTSLIALDGLLTALFTMAIALCRWNGYPVHGPLSAGIAVVGMLSAGPLWSGIHRQKQAEPALQADARELGPAEPPAATLGR